MARFDGSIVEATGDGFYDFLDKDIKDERDLESIAILLATDGIDDQEMSTYPEEGNDDPHRPTVAASRQLCNEILRGSEKRFEELFRMKKAVFWALCRWLRLHTEASGSRLQSLEQKVMVFLWICAFDETQRNAAHRFRMHQSTVSRIVRDLLHPMRKLHLAFVTLPAASYASSEVILNEKASGFEGAIGAVDGTHIPAFIPQANQQRFWSRKNNISQNVLAAVTFDGLFCYVLAGAEGSINDATLLPHAMTRSFKIPSARYYLADAGFGQRKGIVIPYPRVRYHLKDWGDVDQRPQTSKELYNLRHAMLRTVVEQVFGRCKRKWKIIRSSAPEYDFNDQILFVYAVTGLYNFVMLEGMTPDDSRREIHLALTRKEQLVCFQAQEMANRVLPELSGHQTRDYITEKAWESYQSYINAREEESSSGSEVGGDDDDSEEIEG